MEELIAEAKTMAEQGVKELVLVAQETTIYGIDLYGKPSLHLLLKELCKFRSSTGSGFCTAIRRTSIRNSFRR